MHLSLSLLSSAGTEQLATTDINVNIPIWIPWGVGAAALLTFGLFAIVSILALVFADLTSSWKPWKEIDKTVKAFICYGLPVGLVSSYVWFHVNPSLAIYIGIPTFALIWVIVTIVEKRRRRY